MSEQAGVERQPYRIPTADVEDFFAAVQTVLRLAGPDRLFCTQFIAILVHGDYLSAETRPTP